MVVGSLFAAVWLPRGKKELVRWENSREFHCFKTLSCIVAIELQAENFLVGRVCKI